MSLIDELKAWYEDESYPPQNEIDGVKQVSFEYTESHRWGTGFVAVYTDGKAFAAVADVKPATEMQDWGDYGEPEIYPVEPYTETIIKYRKV